MFCYPYATLSPATSTYLERACQASPVVILTRPAVFIAASDELVDIDPDSPPAQVIEFKLRTARAVYNERLDLTTWCVLLDFVTPRSHMFPWLRNDDKFVAYASLAVDPNSAQRRKVWLNGFLNAMVADNVTWVAQLQWAASNSAIASHYNPRVQDVVNDVAWP